MSIDRRSFVRGAAAAGFAAAAAPAAGRSPRRPPANAVGLLYDSTRCVGCQTCVTACRRANRLPYEPGKGLWDAPTDLSSRTKSLIQVADAGGRRSYVKRQCMHCVDPACESVCMLGALAKGPRGVVAYDPSRCIGCRYCQVACPFDVPRFEWDSATPRIVKCELCRERLADGRGPACADTCPAGALRFGPYEEVLAEARERLRALPGRYHQKVYGERDGGGTQVLLLAAVPFEQLGLPRLGDEPVPQLSETLQHGIYRGMIAPAALYALLGIAVWRYRRDGGDPQPSDREVEP